MDSDLSARASLAWLLKDLQSGLPGWQLFWGMPLPTDTLLLSRYLCLSMFLSRSVQQPFPHLPSDFFNYGYS